MSDIEYDIEVQNREGEVVYRVPYRQMVTFQFSDDSEPMRYLAMSWRGNKAHWAKRHLATPARKRYTLLCYAVRQGSETRELVGRFRVHRCNAYKVKPKKGRLRASQYATMVAVAEGHLEKLENVA